jgi:hypothetical protein
MDKNKCKIIYERIYKINKNENKKVEWSTSNVGLWKNLVFMKHKKCSRKVTQILRFC